MAAAFVSLIFSLYRNDVVLSIKRRYVWAWAKQAINEQGLITSGVRIWLRLVHVFNFVLL